MEAIKCPNCGSEKVRELTEEKYVCLACDNEFLVYDRSKELRQVQEHIDKRLDEKFAGLLEAQKNKNGDGIGVDESSRIDAVFENAFNLITIGEYDAALEQFELLCYAQSVTYKSWWGKILATTEDLQILNEELVGSDDMTNCITNMRNCKDYPEEIENRLCEYLEKVFSIDENERLLEEKLQSLESEIDHCRRKSEDLKKQAGQAEEKLATMSRIQKAIKIFALLCAEIMVSVKFFSSIRRSIVVINSPLQDPDLPEAGSAFGNAFLNFLAIPVKFILWIIVAAVVAFVVSKIIKVVFDFIKADTIAILDRYRCDTGEDKIAKNIKQLQKLKGQINFYEGIDIKDARTFMLTESDEIDDDEIDDDEIDDDEIDDDEIDDDEIDDEVLW